MAERDETQDVPSTTEGPGDLQPNSGRNDADVGGRAHTPEGEHPAGDGPRTDRQVGGPVAAEDAEPATGAAHGDIPTPRFEDDPHR